MSKGIKEIKELASLVMGIGNGASKALEDGKLSMSDLVHFQGVVFTALPAIQGIDQVDDEFFDLDEAEKVVLKNHIASELQLDPSHEKIEQITEGVLKVIVDLKDLIKQLVG